MNYNFIQNQKSNFSISIGPLLRYQATSLNSDVTTLFPGFTMLPTPVRVIINNGPGRTITVGATLRFNYNYTVSPSYFVGLQAGAQSDTNGDFIPNLSLGFGRKF